MVRMREWVTFEKVCEGDQRCGRQVYILERGLWEVMQENGERKDIDEPYKRRNKPI
jgi:hypothetical protein